MGPPFVWTAVAPGMRSDRTVEFAILLHINPRVSEVQITACWQVQASLILYIIYTMNKSNRSRQGFTLVEIMIVVVIIGLLAAMAIPAFQKVRVSSQDKAVLNNARQMSAAADQYYLENGASWAAPTSLIGAANYVKALNTVASEVYPTAYTQSVTITVTGVANTRTITYAP
jgi:type IV pilus assembly protein PilA